MKLGPEDVSLLERCPHFRGWYVQASMELGPEDVSLLERCPHFRGWYVQASMELGPEDVSLLERCPHFRRDNTLPSRLLCDFLQRLRRQPTSHPCPDRQWGRPYQSAASLHRSAHELRQSAVECRSPRPVQQYQHH